MRCTDRLQKKKTGRGNHIVAFLSAILAILIIAAGVLYYDSIREYEEVVSVYESTNYNTALYTGTSISSQYCVTNTDIDFDAEPDGTDFIGAGIFDIDNNKVLYANNMFQQLYPASTTKILTALLAIENTDLSEVVTVPEETAADQFASDESTCGLQAGDQLTMKDLLYGMLLESGNDNAATIAYYIAGDMDSFANMMNERAAKLYATQSHFINSNGLHNEFHYTTVYDLYLIFNECIKHQEFIDIVNTDSYSVNITAQDGTTRTEEWVPTNWYQSGDESVPEGMTVIGGKTGTTDEAGNCLILLVKDSNEHSYITIVMGASSKSLLYNDMSTMIEAIPTLISD